MQVGSKKGGRKKKDKSQSSAANLNPHAAAFVPAFKKSPTQSQNKASFDINAPVFTPSQSKGSQPQTTASNFSLINQDFNSSPLAPISSSLGMPLLMAGGADPLNGYVNPFAQKAQLKKKQGTIGGLVQKEEVKKHTYSIEFIMSLKLLNKDRPANMALLDFNHKKRRNLRAGELSEADRFNHTVRELRILLNKLSKDNFDTVARKILQEQSFSPSLLNELMKIIFAKATTEVNFIELYVRLCIMLFKQYNDKENKELNFKKLLLMKCQKQFFKGREQEEQARRSRRESMSVDDNGGNPLDSDFNKQMQYVFDKEELKYRQKLQLFGNMRLIVELYLHGQIPEGIIMSCVQTLIEDLEADQSAEILIQMLQKIAAHVVHRRTLEKEPQEKAKKKKQPYQINIEFVEGCLQKVFSYRHCECLSQRVRFKIQDLIDEYEKPGSWKDAVSEHRMLVDDEGFQVKYVAKDQIMNEEPPTKGKRRGKDYIYVKKEAANSAKKSPVKMKELLQNLKADEFCDQDEDEDVKKILSRKVSMNEQNVVGMNFEKYNDQKPPQDIRRKIANYFAEYSQNQDNLQAKASFHEILKETNIQPFVFVGYILHNAFSQDQAGWARSLALVVEGLYREEQLLTDKEILEGIHVSLANFMDTMIDYPRAKEYSFEMFEKLGELGVLNAEQIQKYKQHVENMWLEATTD